MGAMKQRDYGPVKINGFLWRVRNNKDIDEKLTQQNIVRFIKTQEIQ